MVDPDPYETARRNKDGLDEIVADLHDLYRLWVEINSIAAPRPTRPEPPDELDPQAYLHTWSDADTLAQALRIIGDSRFAAACDRCASLDEVRDRLGLDRQAVEERRRQRREQEREAERQRRTVNVAGVIPSSWSCFTRPRLTSLTRSPISLIER